MSEITKESFIWKTKDKQHKLDEMDVDFKFAALIHCVSTSNRLHRDLEKNNHTIRSIENEIEKLNKRIENLKENYQKLNSNNKDIAEKIEKRIDQIGILEQSFIEDHGFKTIPDDLDDIWVVRKAYKMGLLSQQESVV